MYKQFTLLDSRNCHNILNQLYPGGSDSKDSACNLRDLDQEDPLEEGMATHSTILAWRIPMNRGAWRAAVHGVTKRWTRLSD